MQRTPALGDGTEIGARPLLAMLGRLLGGLGMAWVPRHRAVKEMEILEVMSLGSKRQLVLVTCSGVRYLVGAGAEGVQSIVCAMPGPVGLGSEQGSGGDRR